MGQPHWGQWPTIVKSIKIILLKFVKYFLEKLIKKEINSLFEANALPPFGTLTNNSGDNSDPFADMGNEGSGTLPVRGAMSSANTDSSNEDPFGDQNDNPFGDNKDDSKTDKEDEEIPKEPKEEVISFVEDTLDITTDVPTILKGVKSIIQKRYSSLEDAKEVVEELKNSDDLTKKSVARELERFINIWWRLWTKKRLQQKN